MNSTAIERELGAPLKTFKSPAAALLWYEQQKLARDAHGVNMSGGGGPRSQVSIDSANRTFGVLSACLGATDQYDDPDDPPLHDPAKTFSKLTDWCRPKGYKEMKVTFAAEREGMGVESYNRWMRALLKRYRIRLEARWLLEAGGELQAAGGA